MATGFLFPGQGSQEPGMGRELFEQQPQAAEILDRACSVLDFDIRGMMFDGPAETMSDTQYAQPIIYTCSAMYLEKARSMGISYDYVAGHSLGEYSALYSAGVFSFEDGLALVRQRGLAMSRQNGKGTMAAVMGLTEDELAPELADIPDVVMANLNTPRQIVISGSMEGMEIAGKKLEGREGVIFKRLAVSAAFHSPQMMEAADIMTPLLEKTEFKTPSCHVVSNVTGMPTKDPGEIRSNLIAQITGQVRWFDSIMNMTAAGVDGFYEIGNGRTLRGMNRRIDGAAKCESL
ncbi:MAG: ACP S-malonyltransferase [Lachnospiraceae bacterium]|nr:ACP S-malonyltransferase [Lachnospiraceae bacterium]